jgi:hypothetical protein
MTSIRLHPSIRLSGKESVIVPQSAAHNIKAYSPRILTRSQAAADRYRELALA